MPQTFDCIVLGGGIVGLTLALALGQNDFNVALIEGSVFDFDYDANEYDLRVSAITRASENVFRNLSIWEAIQSERLSPFQKMKVWEEKGHGSIEFDSEKFQQAPLGYIIENRVIRKHLYRKLQTSDNVRIYNPCYGQDLYHEKDKVILQLDKDKALSANLIIGADGARSWLRKRCEFELEEKDYNHHAIVTNVRTQLPHDNIARQRFLSNGILAFLPLLDPHMHSIVWSTEPTRAKQLLALTDTEFSRELKEAFSSALGDVNVISPRSSFPLFMRHVKHYVKPRIALVGDAAHTVHPLAGQGVNLGLLDVACLVDVLVTTRNKRRDFGLMQHLRKYERGRKGENQLMLLAMSGFRNLFDKDSSSIIWARNVGLNLTDKAEPLKQLFVKKAMGLMGDLPSLARYSL